MNDTTQPRITIKLGALEYFEGVIQLLQEAGAHTAGQGTRDFVIDSDQLTLRQAVAIHELLSGSPGAEPITVRVEGINLSEQPDGTQEAWWFEQQNLRDDMRRQKRAQAKP